MFDFEILFFRTKQHIFFNLETINKFINYNTIYLVTYYNTYILLSLVVVYSVFGKILNLFQTKRAG